MRALLLACLAMALVACAPPQSKYMVPSARPLTPAPSDKAVILFVSDVGNTLDGGLLLTVYDEEARFLGELSGVSAFEIQVTPGRHTFHLTDFGIGYHCNSFTGDYAAGKYYLAWYRMNDDSGTMRMGLVFPRPGSQIIDVSQVITAPRYEPDRAGGEAFMASVGAITRECIAREQVVSKALGGGSNPAGYGYDSLPR